MNYGIEYRQSIISQHIVGLLDYRGAVKMPRLVSRISDSILRIVTISPGFALVRPGHFMHWRVRTILLKRLLFGRPSLIMFSRLRDPSLSSVP